MINDEQSKQFQHEKHGKGIVKVRVGLADIQLVDSVPGRTSSCAGEFE